MFGDKVRQLREEQDMNQQSLGKKLHVSKQTVSNWENNNVLPSVDKLCSIATYFSCSVDYLLDFSSSNDIIFKTDNLSESQIGRLRQIITDYQNLNSRISRLESKLSADAPTESNDESDNQET